MKDDDDVINPEIASLEDGAYFGVTVMNYKERFWENWENTEDRCSDERKRS